jgi:hypothetical protein
MEDRKRRTLVQREFVRVPVAIPIEVRCPSKNLCNSPEGWVTGQMIEIGGGGARISVGAGLEMGDVLAVRFRLPDTRNEMKLYGRIVNVTSDVQCLLCLKFVGISEDQRRTILQYAFREQIRIAKGDEAGAARSPGGGRDGSTDN